MFPPTPFMLTAAFLQAGVAQASLPVPVIYIYGENSSSVRIVWSSSSSSSSSSSPSPTEYTVQKLDVPFATHLLAYYDGSRLTGTGHYRVRPMPAWWRPYIGLRVRATIRSQNGVLAFMSSSDQRQYFAIILVEGIPRLTYANNDGCVADVFIDVERTEYSNLSKLTDGREHTIMAIWERGNLGHLRIDQTYFSKMIESNSKCKKGSTLELDTDLYLGGVPRSFSIRSRLDPWLNRATGVELAGCVHSVEVLEQKEAPEIWGEVGWNCSATLADGLPPPSTRSCPSSLHEGIHFMGDGYAVIPNCLTRCGLPTVTNNIQLSFTMRTTHSAGAILFLIHGSKKHYLVGYLVPSPDGVTITFVMYRDGPYPKKVSVSPMVQNNISLCDGQWHNITARKTESAVFVGVDTREAVSGFKHVGYLNLTSPIFLGGVKESPELSAFFASSVWPSIDAPDLTKGFSGCIKDVKINGAMLDVTSATHARNVKMDGCPPESQGQGQGQGDKKRGCISGTSVQTLYRGSNTAVDDLASLPNTDYMYRVLQGNATGPWVYSRTEKTTTASCPARDPPVQGSADTSSDGGSDGSGSGSVGLGNNPGSSDTSSDGGSGDSGSGSIGLGNNPGSSDTSSDGDSGGSGSGSVGLGNNPDHSQEPDEYDNGNDDGSINRGSTLPTQNTSTVKKGAKGEPAIDSFMLYAALGIIGAVTIGTVFGAVGFCWWMRTRSRRPASSPDSERANLSRPASRTSLTAPRETLPLEIQAQVDSDPAYLLPQGRVPGFEASIVESYESTEQTTDGSSWTDDVAESDVDQPIVYVVDL